MAVEDRPSFADHAALPHRLAVAPDDRHRQGPRRPASPPRRSGPPRPSSASRRPDASGCPTTSSPSTGRPAPAGPRRRAGRSAGGPRLPSGSRRQGQRWDAAQAGPGPARLRATSCPPGRRATSWPPGRPSRPCLNAIGARRPRPGLGRRRPDRQHRHHARRRRLQSKEHPGGRLMALRGPRARHGRGDGRHGPPRRGPAGGRHVLRLQRLHAGRGPAGRPVDVQVIFVWTHDSVGLGQDGPTHQPIEQLAAMRAMPNLRRHPAGRRQRDRPGLADRHRARRAHRPDPVPPGPAGPGRHRRAGAPAGQGRLRRSAATSPAPTSSWSGRAARSRSAWPRPSCSTARAACPGGVHAVLGTVRSSRTSPTSATSSAGGPGAGGRSRRQFRLVPVGGRHGFPRPLRRLRPGRRGPGALRLHGRATCRARSGPCCRQAPTDTDQEERQMTLLPPALLRQQGQSPWIDNLTPRLARRRAASPAWSTRASAGSPPTPPSSKRP